MMWYWAGGVHWWGWLLGGLVMVAFWAVLIWAVWYLVTAVARRPEHRPPASGDPKRILDERLARGEITAEEYRRLRDLLQETTSQPTEDAHPVGTGRGR